jgi:poly(3-hydroxybutyrate) depolymerase
MQQWTNVHGIDPMSAVHDTVKGFPHQTFTDATGNAVVETYSITGMSHGDPVEWLWVDGPSPRHLRFEILVPHSDQN